VFKAIKNNVDNVDKMDNEKLFTLAKPYLEKNDLGATHTSRVLAIARENFAIPQEIEDLTVSAIILHDIGGSSIKDQYEKGPKIAASILQQMKYDQKFITQVCEIVGTHHDHPDYPSEPFRILFDSDKIVMFSPEEFPIYNARLNFDWNKIIDLIYSEQGKKIARQNFLRRKKK
jgi:hypothetical protein